MLDALLAFLALLPAAPILALSALAVRLSDGPGVLFRQERVGLDGRPFVLLKFRTLRPSDERESATRWNVSHDRRMSAVGHFLRRTSLDELPQLWNVLRGDMSLVGPRPERPYFVRQFSQTYPGYQERHRMPVGITGLAQIHGLRGDTSIEDRARFDNHYIESWSLWQDIRILLRTATALFRFGGAERGRPPGHRPRPVRHASPARPPARRAVDRWAWLGPLLPAVATVLLLAAPVGAGDVSASGKMTPADAASGVLVAFCAVRALRARTRPLTAAAAFVLGAPVVAIAVATLAAADPAAGVAGFVRYLQVFVLVPTALVLLLRTRRDFLVVAGSVVLLALVQGAFGVYQYATGTGASYVGENIRAVGTFGPSDVMGMATVVAYGLMISVGLALAPAAPGSPAGCGRSRWAAPRRSWFRWCCPSAAAPGSPPCWRAR